MAMVEMLREASLAPTSCSDPFTNDSSFFWSILLLIDSITGIEKVSQAINTIPVRHWSGEFFFFFFAKLFAESGVLILWDLLSISCGGCGRLIIM